MHEGNLLTNSFKESTVEKITDGSVQQTFDNFEFFNTSDKMLSETIDMEVFNLDELAEEKLSFENKNDQFQTTETLFSDELPSPGNIFFDKVDSILQPSDPIHDDFSFKSPNEICSQEFIINNQNIGIIPKGDDFYLDNDQSDEISVQNYFSNFLKGSNLWNDNLGQNNRQSETYNVHTKTDDFKNENLFFGNVDSGKTSTKSDDNLLNNYQSNLNENASGSKYLVEVVHHNVADEFHKVGVKCSIHKLKKGVSTTVFQKVISPTDVKSEQFCEILFSHLILILVNDYQKGLLKQFLFEIIIPASTLLQFVVFLITFMPIFMTKLTFQETLLQILI